MERAIIRMYFDDGAFKTFLIVPATTAADLVKQVHQKLNTDANYYLCFSLPGQAEQYLRANDLAWPLYKQHGERCRFTFRLKASSDAQGQQRPAASPPAQQPPPSTPPGRGPAPGPGAAANGQASSPNPAQQFRLPPPNLAQQPRPPPMGQPQQQPRPPMPQGQPPPNLPAQQPQPVGQLPSPSRATFSGSSPAPAPAPSSGAADDFDALLSQLEFPGAGTSGSAGGFGGDSLGGLSLGMAALGLSAATAPPCGACGQPVTDKMLKAFNMHWHKYHLACAICRRNFDENDVPVVEGSDGKAYCQTDWVDRFAPKCAQCTFAIQGECTNAIGRQYHPQCFVCKTCNNPFTGSFFEHEGFPYCERHYYGGLGLICPECDRPIIGKCVRAKDKRFHPQHFVCSHCKTKLGNSYFFHDNKIFCKKCSIVFYG